MSVEPCTKCGSTIRGLSCPVYHGMVRSGFCPAFRDGMTAVETCEFLYRNLTIERRRHDALRLKVRHDAERPLLVRIVAAIFGDSPRK